MKREVEYHEVQVSFVVSARDAKRATAKAKKNDVRTALSQLIYDALTGNDTNTLDIEDVRLSIDGRPEIGS